MDKFDIDLRAKLKVYEVILEILVTKIFASDPAALEAFWQDVMETVRERHSPLPDEFALWIETSCELIGQRFLETTRANLMERGEDR